MPLDPEGKPLGKESKECASRRQPSCLATCLPLPVLPLLGTRSRDPALVTAWPVRTSWRQPHNPWLLSAQDLSLEDKGVVYHIAKGTGKEAAERPFQHLKKLLERVVSRTDISWTGPHIALIVY